jgi:acyl-CoA synthetase (AMP-forming)/AMP-acid ligase II
MLTHRNLVANVLQSQAAFDALSGDDRVLAILPFFHIYGLVVIMKLGLSRGATIVSMPRFDFGEFLTALQRHRVTIAPLVPPIVLGMVKSPAVDQVDLSSIRLVFSGAAPLGEELARALSKKLGCPVVQGYGMTEASPVTHLSPTRNAPFKPGSIGLVVPNTEVRIVDVVTGDDVPAGEAGELWIRGPQIMQGYLNRPEETAASLDGEGWYHTGDVGHVDAEGWFFIVDRTKELIKYKGMQVAPAELEARRSSARPTRRRARCRRPTSCSSRTRSRARRRPRPSWRSSRHGSRRTSGSGTSSSSTRSRNRRPARSSGEC